MLILVTTIFHYSSPTKITTIGLYLYKVMMFGLKNVGTTYQRLVTKMFREKIGKSMEVYMEDMLVKKKKVADHNSNLGKTFEILRYYKMKLNVSNCTFGVSSGIFWGLWSIIGELKQIQGRYRLSRMSKG